MMNELILDDTTGRLQSKIDLYSLPVCLHGMDNFPVGFLNLVYETKLATVTEVCFPVCDPRYSITWNIWTFFL